MAKSCKNVGKLQKFMGIKEKYCELRELPDWLVTQLKRKVCCRKTVFRIRIHYNADPDLQYSRSQ